MDIMVATANTLGAVVRGITARIRGAWVGGGLWMDFGIPTPIALHLIPFTKTRW